MLGREHVNSWKPHGVAVLPDEITYLRWASGLHEIPKPGVANETLARKQNEYNERNEVWENKIAAIMGFGIVA